MAWIKMDMYHLCARGLFSILIAFFKTIKGGTLKNDLHTTWTPEFKKVNLALFAGGFCTFAILWGTQPLLPDIANEFQISPATSSLSQSSTTIALAFSLLITGSLSAMYGRKRVMTISLVASSILAILTGFCLILSY